MSDWWWLAIMGEAPPSPQTVPRQAPRGKGRRPLGVLLARGVPLPLETLEVITRMPWPRHAGRLVAGLILAAVAPVLIPGAALASDIPAASGTYSVVSGSSGAQLAFDVPVPQGADRLRLDYTGQRVGGARG